MSSNLKNHLWIAGVVVLSFAGCRKDLREEQARQDSLREVASLDSVRQWGFFKSLDARLEMLDELPLEVVCDDCIRIVVVMGWRDSTVGPMMAITASRKDMSFRMRAFPNNRRADMVERQLDPQEYKQLAGILDSARFTSLPLFEEVDYQVFDTNVYYIEQVREGRYYGISRSARVDDFVYQLVSAASLMAGLPGEFLAHFQKSNSGIN
jgi:hypothetical protein